MDAALVFSIVRQHFLPFSVIAGAAPFVIERMNDALGHIHALHPGIHNIQPVLAAIEGVNMSVNKTAFRRSKR
jgi:hypothetical protein